MWSTAELVIGLINGTEGDNAGVILARGASVYVTNIIVFSLWYWEWDRAGRWLGPRRPARTRTSCSRK